MSTPVNFASGADESYIIRYAQDFSDPGFDRTWINSTYNVLAKDIFGNPIDFNKDGLTDSLFLNGLVNEFIGYTLSNGDTVLAASRLPQGEVALGGGRNGGQALNIINIGPDGAGLAGFPDTETFTGDKAAVMDVNGDGYQDIIAFSAASSTANIRYWIYNPLSNTFSSDNTIQFSPGFGSSGEATFNDFNGDGIIDLAWTDYVDLGPDGAAPGTAIAPSSYKVYFGQGDNAGQWNRNFHVSGALAPITFDIDTITRAVSNTAQSETGIPDITPLARDFNGDSHIDLAIGTSTGIRFFTNPGDGRFNPASGTDIAGLGPGFFLKAADFNNDGLIDIASSPNGNSVTDHVNRNAVDTGLTIYINTSTAGNTSFRAVSFAGLKEISSVNGPIATGDMNLDGNIDLVIAPYATDNTRFYVALGDGKGNFESPTAWTGYSNLADPLDPINTNNKFRAPLDIDTGDFNGDGQLDVVTLAGSTFARREQPNSINHIYGVAYNRTFTPPSITTTSLPAGTAGVPYSTQLQATGGDSSKPYSFQLSAASPALPAGLSLQPDGTISGTPQTSGSFSFLAEASQSNGLRGSGTDIALQLTTTTPGGGGGTPQTLTFSDFTSNGTQTIIANIVATNKVTNSDDLNDLSNLGVALSDRAIDFKANIDKERTTSIGNIPLGALLGDLTLTTGDGKRDPSIAPIYYAINAQGALSPLSYDPLINAGARFYDTDGDGIADFLSLKLIDGGFGDKDGVNNGVIDDPSAMGTVALDPVLIALKNGFLQVADVANAAPAALSLQASLTSRAKAVTEIGYVILNEGEDSSAVTDITAFKERASLLFSTLENNDVTLAEAMTFNGQFLLRNGQSIRFFSVTDGTLADLASLEDSRFSFLDGSVDATTGAASFSSASGIGFDLELLSSDQTLGALIAQEQHIAPLLDFTAFTNNETITGTIVQAREADYDAVTGFYRVLDTSGSVRAADGSLLTPGDAGYAAAALLKANRISALGDLSIADGESSSTGFSLQEASYIAPFAQVNSNTFFAFADANADGLSHFRSLGSNLFGLEDQLNGGDLDYDDHIMGFLISSLTPATPAVG